eukprot:GILK01004659.1.p1 GENE.GILK01004659.1~~GILK01004659.1.p1  ORF type:complete len:1074 (+),score=225.12 GILK01004659.1:261-3224(+)
MADSNVLLVGLNGLGVEIAKNVVLAGVKSVTLWDSNFVSLADLSTHFFVDESVIGMNRAEACVDKLAELNPYVNVSTSSAELNESFIKAGNYRLVVVCNASFDDAVRLNDLCRACGVLFISAETRGLFARIFVDFGDTFVVTDATGEEPAMSLVAAITQGNPGVVTCVEDTRHGLETGDTVSFRDVSGMEELNDCPPKTVKVIDPYSFSIDDTTGLSAYARGGYAIQVKQPQTVRFLSMRDSLAQPEFMTSDFAKFDRPPVLHAAFSAMHEFVGQHRTFPQPANKEHADALVALTQKTASSQGLSLDDAAVKVIQLLSHSATGDLAPMTAVIGGIAAQEVLKGCSSKFMPIRQWFYFDAAECLHGMDVFAPELAHEFQPLNTRYDAQLRVLGRTIQSKLSTMRPFLVGAGAIGCEMLKNWALMGVATDPNGLVTVTDMDAIERSNLNRQFLFRSNDVSKLKSTTAAEAILRMNSHMRIEAHANRVGPETEHIYHDDFWESLTGVFPALDNVDARIYVDQKCVFYQKPLVDSGTLGTKGSTQVVIPFLTESYGSSRDPPEQHIPICTIRNFPHNISHTLQWARDAFEGMFKQNCLDVNSYLTQPDFIKALDKQPNTKLPVLESIFGSLVTQKPMHFEDCVSWARLKFEENFNHNIRQLLHNFPYDAVTSTGAPFWSGPKRPPTPQVFDVNDPLHMEFVIAASNLRAFNFGLKGERDVEYFKRVLPSIVVPEFVPQNDVKIATNDAEMKHGTASSSAVGGAVDVDGIVSSLPAPSSLAGYQLRPVEFEKDDDSNYHMDFIAAAGNLRARNYKIPEKDKHECKMIAGKIIPAIATTTALVTGLVCLEMIKLLRGLPMDQFKNGFVNLALPLVSFCEPVACVKNKIGDWEWSIWQRFDMEGEVTLEEFMNFFKERFGFEVSMISHGVAMLYSFFTAKKKIQERLPMRMTELVKTIAKVELKPNQRYLIFEVVCNDTNKTTVDVPFVRLRLK